MKSKLTLLFAAALLLAQATPLMAGCCWGSKNDAQEEAAPAEEVAEEVAEVVAETPEAPAVEVEAAE